MAACTVVAAGLAGAWMFVYHNPEWFEEMMIIVGPWLAAGVAMVISSVMAFAVVLHWSAKVASVMIAGFLAGILSFFFAAF